MRKRNRPEEEIHGAIAAYCARMLPPSVFWTTIGHGGGGAVRGAILHGLGLKAGVPDMLFVYAGRAHFIEIKSAVGSLSKAQRACHAELYQAGARVATARGIDDVRLHFARWGLPSRDAETKGLAAA